MAKIGLVFDKTTTEFKTEGNMVTVFAENITIAGGSMGGGSAPAPVVNNTHFPDKGPEPPLNPNGTPKCPVCHGEMSEKQGTSKAGDPYHFWACKDYKACGTTIDAPFIQDVRCPKCSRMMNKRKARQTGNVFYSCPGYQTTNKDKQGNKFVVRPTICDGRLSEKQAMSMVKPTVEEVSPFADDGDFDAPGDDVPF